MEHFLAIGNSRMKTGPSNIKSAAPSLKLPPGPSKKPQKVSKGKKDNGIIKGISSNRADSKVQRSILSYISKTRTQTDKIKESESSKCESRMAEDGFDPPKH